MHMLNAQMLRITFCEKDELKKIKLDKVHVLLLVYRISHIFHYEYLNVKWIGVLIVRVPSN